MLDGLFEEFLEVKVLFLKNDLGDSLFKGFKLGLVKSELKKSRSWLRNEFLVLFMVLFYF